MGTSSRSSSTLKNPFQTFKSFYTIQPTTRTIRMKFILMLSLTVLVASQVVTSVPFNGVSALCELQVAQGTKPSKECLAEAKANFDKKMAGLKATQSKAKKAEQEYVGAANKKKARQALQNIFIEEEKTMQQLKGQVQNMADRLKTQIMFYGSAPIAGITVEQAKENMQNQLAQLAQATGYLATIVDLDPSKVSQEVLDRQNENLEAAVQEMRELQDAAETEAEKN